MSSRTIQINVKINYPVILLFTLILHALFLMVRGLHGTAGINHAAEGNTNAQKPITVQSIRNIDDVLAKIRTVGARNAKTKDSVYLQKTNSDTKHVTADRFSNNPGKAFKPNESQSKNQHPLSLSDLSGPKQALKPVPPKKAQEQGKEQKTASQKQVRPGTRPDVALPDRPKALNAIALNGAEMKNFMKTGETAATGGASVGAGMNAASVSGDPRAQSLSNSDVMVNLEVPEGVDPDELNKYELMFYGFQRRTAMNYVNSFYKKLDKFAAENPHLQFPLTETKQVMTGRLTYDRDGNIKQIKMVRWSNIDRLQDFFVDVLKDMDTLHNPPQALWEKSGEFSIFFSLVING